MRALPTFLAHVMSHFILPDSVIICIIFVEKYKLQSYLSLQIQNISLKINKVCLPLKKYQLQIILVIKLTLLTHQHSDHSNTTLLLLAQNNRNIFRSFVRFCASFI